MTPGPRMKTLDQDEKVAEEKLKEADRKRKRRKKPKSLVHLNFIENPTLSGVRVSVEGMVSSTSVAYLAPTEIKATYTDQDEEQEKVHKIEPDNPDNLKMICVSEDVKARRIKRLFSGLPRNAQFEETAFRTVYRVRVRPPVFTLEMQGDKVIDETGQEYKSHDIFISADDMIIFQAGALISLIGTPLPSPATQQTTLLVTDISFPRAVQKSDREKIRMLQSHLKDMSVHDRKEWFLDNFEAYSGIISRRNLALGSALTYFAPIWVTLGREKQRGWVILLMMGDTTTAKSLTVKQMIRLLGAGMLVTAETATVVGLIGTTTQVEGRGWFIDWGFIVLCDLGLITIDGFHKLGANQTAVMAESERSGVVIIAKAGRASTYARTRQIRIANAIDKSMKEYVTMPLREFLFPVQALDTIMDKTSIARLDLAVFADSQDVEAKAINKELIGDYDEKLDHFNEVLKWAWRERPEAKFTPKAMKLLLEEATNLYNNFYNETIPLVSIDMKWKLARLSVAMATLTLSTENLKTVTVEEEHVKEVVSFLKEEYTRVGLNTMAKMTRHEKITEDDVKAITSDVAQASMIDPEVVVEICRFIATQGRVTKDQIRTKFSLTRDSQVNPLISTLVNEGMLKRGNGFYPTGRMVEYCRLSVTSGTSGPQKKEPPKYSQETIQVSGKSCGIVSEPSRVTEVTVDDKNAKAALRAKFGNQRPAKAKTKAPDINNISLRLQLIWRRAGLESIDDPLLDKDMEKLPKSDIGFLTAQIAKKHVIQEKAGQWVLSETVKAALKGDDP